jgi:hypothetical protein
MRQHKLTNCKLCVCYSNSKSQTVLSVQCLTGKYVQPVRSESHVISAAAAVAAAAATPIAAWLCSSTAATSTTICLTVIVAGASC